MHRNTLQQYKKTGDGVQEQYNTLQHTATHRNTLPHTATQYNTPQHNATHCYAIQRATHCNTLQQIATEKLAFGCKIGTT